MKRLLIITGLFVAIGLSSSINAQVSVNVNVNLGQQPAWGPAGYDYAGYYYFPDLNIYYDVANSLFYYLSGSKWTGNQYLPEKYKKYDLYGMYKVVINDNQPWQQNKTHKKEYAQYKNDKTQTAIRYAPDNNKYSDSKQNDRSWINRGNNAQTGNQQGNKQQTGNSSNQGKTGNTNNKQQTNNQQGGRK